jgi:hypothetical protein
MAHTNTPAAGGDPHAVHGHGAINHETSDLPLGGTTRVALFVAFGIGLVMVLMWGAWGLFLSQAHQGDPGKPAMAPEDYGQRLPAPPRLQSVPSDDLAAYRAQQTAKLEGLAWVDQSAGEVRIPIQAAMQLIVQRADAFADPQAKAPADHSWSFPGASMPAGPASPASPAATPAHGEAAAPAAAPAHGGGH